VVFNDPRRFGFVSLFGKDKTPTPFRELGPEPLGKQFTAEYLFKESRNRLTPMKSFLLDQKTVAGLGNIYVCEALFMSGIKPTRKAKTLKMEECQRLVPSIQQILVDAIEAGGSTIRDYKNAEGKAGAFQTRFRVYEREGKGCVTCGKKIKWLKQSGRSTYWCSQCQR
jgi:formamidopyrimidine-DNA glycosylase